jgi:hypothetical protein
MHLPGRFPATVRRSLSAASLLFVLCPIPGRTSVCEEPGPRSFVAAAVVDHDTSLLDQGAGSTAQVNQSLQVLVRGSDNVAFGYDHRYTKFDFEGIEPQTNAHLHSAAFPLHWRRGEERSRFRVGLAPTLSTSSNVLGHPRRYSTDILQMAFALMWERPLSGASGFRYGLCGDDRFGRYKVFPAAVFEWRPHSDWELNLGFPVSRVTLSLGDLFRTGIMAMPDGSEWHVMDREFAAESQFVHESYVVEWMLALDAGEHLSIAAGFGRQMGNRFEMTLATGEKVEVEGKDVNRARFELKWRF